MKTSEYKLETNNLLVKVELNYLPTGKDTLIPYILVTISHLGEIIFQRTIAP
jgi:hypothetical protein